MVQNHLARLAAPKHWTLQRKQNRWTARPSPGPHPLNECLTINIILKDRLKHAKTSKEVRYILTQGWIEVDKKIRKDYKFPVGLMDVFEIPKTKEAFRILYDQKGRLQLVAIDAKESDMKLIKITGKTVLKKGKMQVNLKDGKNLLVDKFKGNVGDTAVYDLKNNKIKEVIPFDKGTSVYLTSGGHIGKVGTVKEILRGKGTEKAKVEVKVGKESFITAMDYALAVGAKDPIINVEVKQK